jgi:hypothetical protein
MLHSAVSAEKPCVAIWVRPRWAIAPGLCAGVITTPRGQKCAVPRVSSPRAPQRPQPSVRDANRASTRSEAMRAFQPRFQRALLQRLAIRADRTTRSAPAVMEWDAGSATQRCKTQRGDPLFDHTTDCGRAPSLHRLGDQRHMRQWPRVRLGPAPAVQPNLPRRQNRTNKASGPLKSLKLLKSEPRPGKTLAGLAALAGLTLGSSLSKARGLNFVNAGLTGTSARCARRLAGTYRRPRHLLGSAPNIHDSPELLQHAGPLPPRG